MKIFKLLKFMYLKECILTVKVRSPTFQMDDTFGIPLTVKDYGKTDIDVGHSTHLAYLTPNSHVNILVCMLIR